MKELSKENITPAQAASDRFLSMIVEEVGGKTVLLSEFAVGAACYADIAIRTKKEIRKRENENGAVEERGII